MQETVLSHLKEYQGVFSHNKEPNEERAHAQHANFVIGHWL